MIKSFKIHFLSVLLLTALLHVGVSSNAKETVAEKTETIATQAVDGVKTGIEDVREKVCQLVDGKLKCAYKKIKRKLIKK